MRTLLPGLSVVIPTRNRLEVLLEALRRLKNGSHMPDEVIIVDDCSEEPVVNQIESEVWPFLVRVLRNTVPGGASFSRNRGIREATGEILLLMDDDVWPEVNMIYYHKVYHVKYRDRGYAVLGRVIFDPEMKHTPLTSFLENYGPHSVMMAQREGQVCDGLVTANVSLKRPFLAGKRLFDESFPFNRNEDTEFGQRLLLSGFKPCFHNAASARHHSYLEIGDWLQILNQSGQCKAHWAMVDSEGCVFTSVLDRVFGHADGRRSFNERFQSGLEEFGPRFLDNDVADLSSEELDLFCLFMQTAQPWIIDFGMFDYWTVTVPTFRELAVLYDRARRSTDGAFASAITEYFKLTEGFVPGLVSGLKLCNVKGAYPLTISMTPPDSNWCQTHLASALFHSGDVEHAMETCYRILSATGSGRIVDREQRNFILAVLAEQRKQRPVAKFNLPDLLTGRFQPAEFYRNEHLRRLVTGGAMQAEDTCRDERLASLVNAVNGLKTL